MNKSMLLRAGLFSLVCLPIAGLATTTAPSSATPPTGQSQPSQNQSTPEVPIIVHGAVVPGASQTTAPTTTTTTTTTSPTTPVTPTELTPSTPTNPTAATAAAATAAAEAAAAAAAPGQSGATPAQPGTPTGTTINTPTTNKVTPPQPQLSTSITPTPAPTTPALDCNYPIPPSTTNVDTTLVLQWGQKAAQQTFTFDPNSLDSQLAVLKACYTEQGWQSFNDALQKSGNLDAIKKENLTVSNMLDGQASITATKNNQWKVIVPIQVVYQNDKEKIAQSLTINLTITRKVSGDLGVMQIVAMPRQTTPATTSPSTTPATTATPSSAPAAGGTPSTTPPTNTQ